MLSQLDQLDLAASYIKQLRERVEQLKGRKEQAMRIGSSSDTINDKMKIGTKLPLIDLREFGSSIEVILITGLQKNFMLSEVLSILQEEGAEVVSASFSAVNDKVFHTIHAQVLCRKLIILLIILIREMHATQHFLCYFVSSRKQECWKMNA